MIMSQTLIHNYKFKYLSPYMLSACALNTIIVSNDVHYALK